MQRIADTLDAAKIDAVLRKWLRRVPHPFAPAHRAASYLYQLSILQNEFALTQVLDRPLTGRCFFEEIFGENLDIGRPDQMQLIFNRRVTRRTPGGFRTRVLTEGVRIVRIYALRRCRREELTEDPLSDPRSLSATAAAEHRLAARLRARKPIVVRAGRAVGGAEGGRHQRPRPRRRDVHSSRNVTVSVMMTGTGTPLSSVGLNTHCRTASSAA